MFLFLVQGLGGAGGEMKVSWLGLREVLETSTVCLKPLLSLALLPAPRGGNGPSGPAATRVQADF